MLAVAATATLALLPRRVSSDCAKVDMTDAVFTAVRDNIINVEEAVEFAYDGDIYTKWVDYTGGAASWTTVEIPSATAVRTYGVVSANDAAERDPANWTLRASADGGSTWVVLDSQTGVQFTARHQRRAFDINFEGAAYNAYQLSVTAVAGGAATELMQVAEFELWSGAECHDPCCGVDCGDHGACNADTGLCTFVSHSVRIRGTSSD